MGGATRGTWMGRLGLAGGVFLGGVLLLAAGAKLLEPGAFVQQVRIEGLDFLFSAEVVAVLALGLEAGLGLALLLGCRHRAVLVPVALLVAFFVFLTSRNYWLVAHGLRDPKETCGCFGSLVERSPSEAFWQDSLLLVPALLVAFFARGGIKLGFPGKRVALALVVALVTAVVAWNSPEVVYSGVAARIAAEKHDPAFHVSPNYALLIDGEETPGAHVYQSDASVGLLALAPQLPWAVMIDPPSGKYRRVERSQIRSEGGLLHLPEGAEFPEVGALSGHEKGIAFDVDGKICVLTNR